MDPRHRLSADHLPDTDRIDALLVFAEEVGATRAARLDPEVIRVESRLAAYCRTPKCPHFGLSMSCPPNVSGPPGMKKMVENSRHAIVIRIEVDSDSLHGEQRPELMRLLHEITAAVEIQARKLGFAEARAFAGGSCKMSFCADHDRCLALSENGNCRYPDQARPSMSGELMKAAGWSTSLFPPEDRHGNSQLSWIAGLILLS